MSKGMHRVSTLLYAMDPLMPLWDEPLGDHELAQMLHHEPVWRLDPPFSLERARAFPVVLDMHTEKEFKRTFYECTEVRPSEDESRLSFANRSSLRPKPKSP